MEALQVQHFLLCILVKTHSILYVYTYLIIYGTTILYLDYIFPES